MSTADVGPEKPRAQRFGTSDPFGARCAGRTGRRWRVLPACVAWIMIVAAPLTPTMVAAEAPTGRWEVTGLTQTTERLFTPAGGALLARARVEIGGPRREALVRSDDAGASSHEVALPPESQAAVVDPSDDGVAYVVAGACGAAEPRGVYKTVDAGASWRPSLLLAPETCQDRIVALEVSPADPRVVYFSHVVPPGYGMPETSFTLVSRDAGASWNEVEQIPGRDAAYEIGLFVAHPADARRAFRAPFTRYGVARQDPDRYRGTAVPNLGVSGLEQSFDQGTTWLPVAFGLNQRIQVIDLAFGTPGRIYLAGNRHHAEGGSVILMSADDGQSWTTVVSYEGGATARDPRPLVTVGGLAVDPGNGARLFAAMYVYDGQAHHVVRASDDAGATWAELGGPLPAYVTDLAVSADGAALYAGTLGGVWRLSLR